MQNGKSRFLRVFIILLTFVYSARELQAQESMAAARYRPPALRSAKDTSVENISGGDVGGDLAPQSFPQSFRRARAGTLPSNVQLAAQRYASTLPAAPISDYETNEISNNTGINLNTSSATRPSLRHATSMAPAPSATIGGERNSRLRSGSLTLPSAGLSNAFGPSIFSSSWLPNNGAGFPALDEMRSITSGDSMTGGDEYDVHTLDYLGLDDGPSTMSGLGRPMPMPATVSELRNQAQAAIVGHQAQNPSRNRSQTISNFARARSGTTSMVTAPTIEHSDDEDEIGYSGNSYGRQRMDSFEGGGLYGGNGGYATKPFRQNQHLSPNASLLARPRAISVGILDDPNRAAAQRRTAAANAAIEQSSGSLHRKTSYSNMNEANQGILNTSAVYNAAPTSILRQPSFNMDDENAMYAGRLARQNSASVRFPTGDVTTGQMGNNSGRQVHLSAPIIGRGESRSVSPKMEGPSQIQTPSRSLWIGNLDPTMTGEDLAHVFAPYGAIESFRLLPEKECGFVNFVDIADAMRAKDDVLNRLSGHIGMNNNQAVRIGFGKADSAPATPPMGIQASNAGVGLGAHIQSQFTPPGQLTPNQNQANAMDSQLQSSPTRALWIGSIPSTTTPATILSVFSPYGPIESARVLTHKNCGFVNFERLDDAVRARKALNGRDVLGSDVGAIRIGFARVPVKNSGSGDGVDEGMGAGVQGVGDLTVGATIHALRTVKGAATIPADQQVLGGSIENYRSNLLLSMIGSASITEQQMVMLELSGGAADADADIKSLGEFRPPTMYYSTIPLVAERPHNRRWDASKLRELRKRLDSGTCSVEEIDAVAADFLDGEIVDLASDWLGNTVVQKLFEKCSPGPRLAMLDRIAPHLAMIGIHKNGTWAAQKIIECATTPEEMALVITNLRPYAPPLLLDQFGNYVVQCCLRFGPPANDFIFDAVVDRLWEVAQGRFGARSMRACLESPQITLSQQRKIATAIVLNSIPLATNPNGALLLTWLLDSSGFQSRYKLLAPRFTPHLAHLCTHKLASLTVLRIVNQRIEPDASQQIARSLFNSPGDHVLTDVLGDQVNGVAVVHKILISPFIDPIERPEYLEATKRVLIDLKVTVTQAYRRLIEEVGLPLPNFQPAFAQPVPQPAKKNSGGPTAPYGMSNMPAGYQQPGDGLTNMMQALQLQPGLGPNGQGLQINPAYATSGVPGPMSAGPMSAGPPSGTSPATFSPTNDPFNPFARSPDMAPRGNNRRGPPGQFVPQQGQQMYNTQQGTPSLAQVGNGLMGMGQAPYGMPPNPMPPNPMPPQMYQAYMQNFVQPNSTTFHT
ncbi:Pumilio domain-containing protein C56F2,08c [Rhizoctonia solani AG-1 IB]|uniref:Pumilio domain-containing protein C56F2,08c n=1 Tax=Thanatephorus cucumeris (strain AG1-IB / isolate 7/3/14) TaxID=1108050 RepID=M5BME8_THACB|nr:Pumilio domain-containing protein C56F2,08c [Rhizoctonia solani AG-1 IB]